MLLVHKPFTNGAVLQRDHTITLSGRALAGTHIHAVLSGSASSEVYRADADAQGRWEFQVPPHPAGGPYHLELSSHLNEDTLVLSDLLFGDVFLLSGQSNMQLTVSRTLAKIPPRFAALEEPRIREYRIAIQPSFDTENLELPGDVCWQRLDPTALPDMGALGVAFAERYLASADVPVGLINCAVGGTPVESWLPHEDLADAPHLLEDFTLNSHPATRAAVDCDYAATQSSWLQEASRQDLFVPALADEARDALPWTLLTMPRLFSGTAFEKQQGVYWLRIRFHLAAEDLAKIRSLDSLRLELGALYHADETYLNGFKVGETGYQSPPRLYSVAPGQLRGGSNEVLIRLTVFRNNGGAAPGKFYGLTSPDWQLAFSENWQILRTAAMPPLAMPRFWDRLAGTNYYAYIQPLKGLPLAGILWYQGESNDADPGPYAERFKRLIRRFRSDFGPQLPFLFVQLTRFEDPECVIVPNSWAQLREAQRQALVLPDTAMIVSLDVGEWNDLHPQDKWTLGRRAALAARALVLGEQLEYSGPCFKSVRRSSDDRLQLTFSHCNGSLQAQGDLRDAFCFVGSTVAAPLTVEVAGDSLILELPQGEFSELRFLYANNPPEVYLYNDASLPASPFVIKL